MEAVPSTSRGSRRAFIAAGLGGLVATAVHALGRPLPARAGHDGTNVLHIGEVNDAPTGATTRLFTDVAGTGTGFAVHNPNGQALVGSSAIGIGVFGNSDTDQGGQFRSESGRGVLGGSESGPGVQGVSETGPGGEFFAGGSGQGPGIGVTGRSGSGEGGHFESTSGSGGVGISQSSHGLFGQSQSGNGVFGGSDTGVGGHFQSQSDVGVQGVSPGAVPAIQARSADPSTNEDDGGLALDVRGKARFSTAGSGTVPAGQNAGFVPNVLVTADSHVSVTLVSDPGPRQLHWVARQPGVGFTVQLTSAPLNKRPETTFTFLIVEGA